MVLVQRGFRDGGSRSFSVGVTPEDDDNFFIHTVSKIKRFKIDLLLFM